jgi:predicted aspartyl protease
LEDALKVKRGTLAPEKARVIEVTDALVDSGATGLLLPKRYIQQLGLDQVRSKIAMEVGGKVSIPIYSSVRSTLNGRDCPLDVGEISDDLPVLIGQTNCISVPVR